MKRIPAAVRRKAKSIRLLLLDVDGVLTDGGIILNDRGVETKRFDVRDGLGITLLQLAGIQVGFITARRSNVVRQRARELGVKQLYQAVKDKGYVYREIKRKARRADEQIAYMGDDLGDLVILTQAGLAATVPAATELVRRTSHYVTEASGGHGAVRELAELLLKEQNLWKKAVGAYLNK